MVWPFNLNFRNTVRSTTCILISGMLLILLFTGCSTLGRGLECLKACDQPSDNSPSMPKEEPAPAQSSPGPENQSIRPGWPSTSILSATTRTRSTLRRGSLWAGSVRSWAYSGAVFGPHRTSGILSYDGRRRAGAVRPYEVRQVSRTKRTRVYVQRNPGVYARTPISHMVDMDRLSA